MTPSELVQGRFQAMGSSTNIAVATSTAFTLAGHVVQIGVNGTDSLTIDGSVYSLPVGDLIDFDNGAVLASSRQQ
jgi:hypothetical protein